VRGKPSQSIFRALGSKGEIDENTAATCAPQLPRRLAAYSGGKRKAARGVRAVPIDLRADDGPDGLFLAR